MVYRKICTNLDAHEVFNTDGMLKDKKQEDQIKKIGANVAKMLIKLSA
jgi:hypothetical protein